MRAEQSTKRSKLNAVVTVASSSVAKVVFRVSGRTTFANALLIRKRSTVDDEAYLCYISILICFGDWS